jgi:hypothetical protein
MRYEKHQKDKFPHAFLESYSHFIGILAHDLVYTEESNDSISTSDFAYRQSYL